MDNRALYIVRQNYTSKCFKCEKEKFFFTVYRCGKCDPQTVEKYCYECCEASLTSEDDEEEEDDDKHINALCEGCAFCYDYIHVSNFYKKQKKGGWQGLKFDCVNCTCCCGGPYCVTGSICCCVPEGDEFDSEEEEEKRKKGKNLLKKYFEEKSEEEEGEEKKKREEEEEEVKEKGKKFFEEKSEEEEGKEKKKKQIKLV